MTLANTEIIERMVGRWSPSDVAFIRRLAFENCTPEGFDVVLVLLVQPRPLLSAGWPDPSGPFWEVEIGFRDVRDLEFVVRGPGDVQSPGFDIEDIRDRQWDGVNLLVHDYEAPPVGAPIPFGARRAEVLACRAASQPPNSPDLWRELPGAYPHHLDDAP
jgi:hypothetical protein